jgi:beta-glucosidase
MPTIDVEHVLAALTLEEKASLVLGSDFWHTAGVPRLDVPRLMLTDGPHGLRKQPDEGPDHAGIGGSAPATCFPTAAALASSWDVELLTEVGGAIGHEALVQGVSVVLGPGINMKRSPLCGRNFEYFSEDPFLAGALATAMVQGIQEHGVGTSVKHFAANNQEDDRLRVSAEVDERTLREIYLPAFEAVVTDGMPWTVMCAYNKVNGTYASQHHWLLTEVLREEWGFDGLVVSDWGAVHDRVTALAAGLDLEMPPALGHSDRAVVDAVRDGNLDEAALDTAVRRMLRLVARAQPALAAPPPKARDNDHHALARRAAAASAVLLKNDGILPLTLEQGARLAVVGAFAATPRFQGAGSSQVTPTRVDVPVDELRAALPGVDVTYAAGFTLDDEARDADGARTLLEEARAVAAAADTVVLFVGLPPAAESEGFDRAHLDLPSDQLAVIEAVTAANPRTVVVLANGSVVLVSGWQDRAAAVLECWLGGQAAGGAVADLLSGAVTPSGKLAETIPHRLIDVPSFLHFPGDSQVVHYGEGLFIGYRGFDALERDVAYPFGYGLSTTSFELGAPEVVVEGSVASGDLAVQVTVPVTNTGSRPGAEVVQVYVADPVASVHRPRRELRGFAKVPLVPGETALAQITLHERAFAYWSIRLHRWVVEAGEFVLHVGTSSRDLPFAHAVQLDAPSVAAPLTADSTLHEWLADPQGAQLLAAGEAGSVMGGGLLSRPEMISVVGTMPLSTLANFGMGLTHEMVAGLVARLRSTPP